MGATRPGGAEQGTQREMETTKNTNDTKNVRAAGASVRARSGVVDGGRILGEGWLGEQ